MSNLRYLNQPNNFWDFVASLQDPSSQAMFGQQRRGPPQHEEHESADPFDGQWASPFGQMLFRSRPDHPRGPPPPPEHEGEFEPEHHGRHGPRHGHPHGRHGHGDPRGPPPQGPPPHAGPQHEHVPPPPPPPFAEDPPSRAPTPPTPPTPGAEPQGHGSHHHGGPPHHRRGRSGHPHGPHGPHGRGGHPHGHGHGRGRGGPRGPWGPPRGGPGAFPFDLSALAEAFAPGLFNAGGAERGAPAASGAAEDGTFSPEVDVFDTETAYIIHASLPGAKKSDLSITYSAQRSSLNISGVVTRPGVDEEMMTTLALDERKVGAFEREVRLDDKTKIDEDGIAAKLEDGVLRVTVSKYVVDEDEEYVDVKKVELE